MNLNEAASLSAIAAIVTLVISAITLALFFGGAGAFWGPINDVFVAFTTLLLVLPILAVLRLASGQVGPWFTILSVAAIGGAIVIAIGQLSLVARLVSLQTSFVVGGVGVVPLLLWVAGLAYLGIARDVIPAGIGYLAGGMLALAAVATVSSMALPASITTAASVALVGTLAAWMWALAQNLRSAS